MPTTSKVGFDSLQPPSVPLDVLKTFASKEYDLRGEWKTLTGERDQNFHVVDVNGGEWLFRLCNPHERTSLFECQVQALEHVAKTDSSLPVPRVRQTLEGQSLGILRNSNLDHCVIILSFLPGSVIGTTNLPADQLHLIGQIVARLGKALQGFIHAAPGMRHLAWDHRNAADLLEYTHVLPVAQQARAKKIILSFCNETLPIIAKLRRQIIHGDVHPYNTLINKGTISGVIDFGDLVQGAFIQDLANTIADYISPGANNARIVLEITKGYQSITALQETEIDILLPLIRIRLLMAPIILSVRAEGGAEAISYPDDPLRTYPLLDELENNATEILNVARRAATFPPRSTTPPPTVENLLERRRAVMGNNLYIFYERPLHLVKGEGVWLTADDGRKYLDCYNNVPHVGHCHPYVVGAIERQLHTLNTNTRYLSEQSIAYAERLTATVDKSLKSVIYVNSGSEANDVAWRMAKAWTGKSGGLTMEFAYHGITDSIDPFSPSNDAVRWNAPHIRLLPPPDDYRGPYKRGANNLSELYADLADGPIRQLSQTEFGVAAGMVDSSFMSNGMLEAPSGYLSRVVAKIRASGGLFIADEVQSGFGRMGTALWGHQHHGVVPDFVTIGKPAGNGHPIGVIITRPEILSHFTKHAAFFSTFGGNNVSCAAGLAVLDVINDENLIENSKITGAYLKARLLELKKNHSLIGDVRGTGLAVGIELVRDHFTLEPATAETTRVVNLVREQGVLFGSEGAHGNILKIRPPIVFQPDHADIAVSALDRALLRARANK